MMLMFGASNPTGTIKINTFDSKFIDNSSYDTSSWFDEKPSLKAQNPLMNLPYIIDHTNNNIVISQTNACFSYLGRRLNLWPKEDAQISMCEQLLCELMDLRNLMVRFSYAPSAGPDVDKSDAVMLVCNSNKIYEKLELSLSAQPSPHTFLVGKYATSPDFHLFEMIDQIQTLAKFYDLPPPLSNLPGLQSFFSSFSLLEENQRYLTSPYHLKLPFNNKRARFGSQPGGEQFVAGQDYDWGNVGQL